MSFLGGLTGQFYRQFALTLAVSVGISLIVALTLTPALCALLLKPTEESHFGGPLGRAFGVFNRAFNASLRDIPSRCASAFIAPCSRWRYSWS